MPVLSTDPAFASRWSAGCDRGIRQRARPGIAHGDAQPESRSLGTDHPHNSQRSDHARPLPLPHRASIPRSALELAQADAESEGRDMRARIIPPEIQTTECEASEPEKIEPCSAVFVDDRELRRRINAKLGRDRNAVLKLFTLEEVAATFRVSRRTMLEYVRRFPFYRKLGNRKLFTRDDISALYEGLQCPSSSLNDQVANTGTYQARSEASLFARARALTASKKPRRSARSSKRSCSPVSP